MDQQSEPQSSGESASSGETSSARLRVLEMIDEGKITAEEGLRLLQAFSAADTAASADESTTPAETPAVLPLDETELPLPGGASINPPPVRSETIGFSAATPEPAAAPEIHEPQVVIHNRSEPIGGSSPATPPEDALKWKRWWMVPVWIGVAITVFGGLFMYLAMQSSGIGFWFVCASLPFILGLLLIILAWGSRNAPWLHLRVRQPPGQKPEKIAFSMPLPVKPAVWFLHTFGHWIPELKEHAWDEVIMAVGEKANPDNPLYVVVDEEETGEKVEVYIG